MVKCQNIPPDHYHSSTQVQNGKTKKRPISLLEAYQYTHTQEMIKALGNGTDEGMLLRLLWRMNIDQTLVNIHLMTLIYRRRPLGGRRKVHLLEEMIRHLQEDNAQMRARSEVEMQVEVQRQVESQLQEHIRQRELEANAREEAREREVLQRIHLVQEEALYTRIAAYSDQTRPNLTFVSTSWRHLWDPTLGITLIRMSAMANATPIVTTVTKNANNEKAPDAASRVNILNFCEEHYEDILPIIMEKARRDKRKEVQTRLNFGENPKRNGELLKLKGRKLAYKIPPYCFWGVEESYGDTYSRGTRTKYRDRSHDKDRSHSVKRWRESESPSSESSTSNGGHWKSRTKRRKLVDEDDLAVPWTCEDVDPFTQRIHNFKSSRKTRKPNNVKTYDGTEDHLKIFQVAAQVERWVMPTWCHMYDISKDFGL
ncbi:hypothetical protein Tco_0672816 [Tanacetum coccineum]